ncbi:hypothetical protein SAMN02745165_00909 [Malonomonas rubra DSM 5091]|uniref:Uncharacterized protein n=1 Tax=Malonomonas rubra DSM 5091 TaxID=1122189 RepID=A0A1M6E2N2_MALRU|nr:hypothetical protein [Malonomonas rubra]SHI79649.1 hypothetical protein SAMN02745165_00909 [Malonomonas rubra DSM 5091]
MKSFPALLLFVFLVSACAKPFDATTCLEDIPEKVRGLQVLQGPRTENSIIADMRPAVCNAQVLFNQMLEQGDDLPAGELRYRVQVEYTGEAGVVELLDDSIGSNHLATEVRDFIMDSDFVNWSRHDDDAVFIYPIRLQRY